MSGPDIFDYSNLVDSNANQYLNTTDALTSVTWPGFLVLTINVPPTYNILPSNVYFYVSFCNDQKEAKGQLRINIKNTIVTASFVDANSSTQPTAGRQISITKSNIITVSDVFDSTTGTMTFWVYFTSKKPVTFNTSESAGNPHATEFTGILIGYGDYPSLDTARIQITPPSTGWTAIASCTSCDYMSMSALNSQGNYLSNLYTYNVSSYSTNPGNYPIVNPYSPPKTGNDWGKYVFLGLPILIIVVAIGFIAVTKLTPKKEDISTKSVQQIALEQYGVKLQ